MDKSSANPNQLYHPPELPDYELTFLGSGAFAKVFKGVNKNNGKVYALKITDFSSDSAQGIPS